MAQYSGTHSFRIGIVFLWILWITFVVEVRVDASGELGSIECTDGKWKIDTRLMALVMTCPLPLDGDADSLMKMAKCAMNKLGIYDGQELSDDFTDTACNVFSQKDYRDGCRSHANTCALISGIRFDWETLWPVFGTCFIPWVMSVSTTTTIKAIKICNI